MGIFYILVVSLFVLSPVIKYHYGGREFEAIAWQSWQESEAEPSLRWEMTRDLTNRYQLRGMPISQVKELLGEPDTEYSDGTISYFLGMSGRGINTGSLILKVKDSVVVDFDIWQG